PAGEVPFACEHEPSSPPPALSNDPADASAPPPLNSGDGPVVLYAGSVLGRIEPVPVSTVSSVNTTHVADDGDVLPGEDDFPIHKIKVSGSLSRDPMPSVLTTNHDTDDELTSEYAIDGLRAHRQSAGGKDEYLVHWHGYPDHDDIWEPAENISPVSIRKYWHASPVDKPTAPPRPRRRATTANAATPTSGSASRLRARPYVNLVH
ncbi:hypothetical protein B9479_008169, partial [Cryptococcus floricola]